MPKIEPERSCIVTREVLPKEALIRFVLSPESLLTPDIEHKLPGRGVYVSCSATMLQEAIERKLFSRAFKQPVAAPDHLEAMIFKQLHQRVVNALSLVRKARMAVSGFEKVADALKSQDVICLIHADDAGVDGIAKLKPHHEEVVVIHGLAREVLSQVMGKQNAVHLALFESPVVHFFLKEARRFALFIGKTGL
jgi:uncharacterized protein